MDQDSQLEVAVGSDGISVKGQGKQVAGLIGSISELISPFSQTFGMIGDQVRIYRELSLLRAIKRAREIVEKENIALKEPPSKFLIHWMEGASMEDDASALTDLWAQLLVSASTAFQPGHLLFMRLLREITVSEVDVIRRIAHANGAEVVREFELVEATLHWNMFDAPASPIASFEENLESDEFIDFLYKEFNVPGVAVTTLEVWEGKHPPYSVINDFNFSRSVMTNDDEIVVDILSSLNIISKIEKHYFIKDSEDLSVLGYAYCLTPMGAAFYTACAGPKFVEKHRSALS